MRSLVPLSLSALLLGALSACASPGSAKALEREAAALRHQVADLEAQVEVLLRLAELPPGTRLTVCPAYPQIDGLILEVDSDRKLVVLDKGQNDGVKVGYVFDVYLASTYKGQVRIQDVQESTSTGMILNEMNAIASGDSATTGL